MLEFSDLEDDLRQHYLDLSVQTGEPLDSIADRVEQDAGDPRTAQKIRSLANEPAVLREEEPAKRKRRRRAAGKAADVDLVKTAGETEPVEGEDDSEDPGGEAGQSASPAAEPSPLAVEQPPADIAVPPAGDTVVQPPAGIAAPVVAPPADNAS